MPAADLPASELARLADLHDHEILDTAADPALQSLTALAAELFGVPIAVISLVDADRQWHLARCGLEPAEIPRRLSFCAHGLLGEGPLLVEDAGADPRFQDHPMVTGAPGIRFYAGAPVRSAAGRTLGSFCLVGFEPRRLGAAEVRRLEALAGQAARSLELHRRLLVAERRANLDAATGLPGPDALEAAINRSLKEHPVTLVADLRLRHARRFAAGTDRDADATGAALREVAARLRASLAGPLPGLGGDADRLLAGLGAGRFGVLVGGGFDAGPAQAALSAALAAALDEDVLLPGRVFCVQPVVGTALADRSARGRGRADDAATGAELLARAALAAAEAERDAAAPGPGPASRAFDRPMLRRTREAAELESRLRAALRDGRVRPALQPVVELSSARLLGFEALARWTDPAHGPVSPAVFVPLAERAGLADELFRCVAEPALAALPSLSAAAGPANGPFLSLNLSKLQLQDAALAERVAAMAAGAGVSPDRIHLELTESDVAESPAALATMHRLVGAGFELMLDDFGTGTSTLASLHLYPVHWLKIDRGFTAAAARGWRVAAIADAVADLARKLGLRTVAEGIETAEELPMFQAMGFELGQGYLFARPMHPAAAADWVRERVRGGRWGAGAAAAARAA